MLITKEQYLLLEFIDKIQDPDLKKYNLIKLKTSLTKENKDREIQPYNLSNILKGFEPHEKKNQ